ncbi:MAG: arginine--tRNA ligase [Lachnospiraceae bacterium]|nr:MAG: arginine--tRNA ligase [Lachnospiraceae bacterium]
MESILEVLTKKFEAVFEKVSYDKSYATVGVSNRPDLCEFQCNGAMSLAKLYKKKPLDIALEVVEKLKEDKAFSKLEAVPPGFINMSLSNEFLSGYLQSMSKEEKFGINITDRKDKIIVDYGGANVAKPLHVGHLRSAIIGESIKRLGAYFGNEMIGDVHLGDWGLQMGLIIEQLKCDKPDLVYFDENYNSQYPKEAPFSLEELEEIYPKASARSKEDKEFRDKAQENTLKLQSGYAPYIAIWEHIMRISKADLKKNYDNLDVHFELWKGESDAQKYIEDLCKDLEERKIAYISDGALVVDIGEEGDTKELPPCIIRKSDGAALYATSDLATLIEREMLYDPDAYIYVADKRQELHYTQFFRVARKANIVKPEHRLSFIGFGTMNGSDGKPFKTRDGGVMRLEHLISLVNEAVYKKIKDNRDIEDEEAKNIASTVGLAALKYGDLSNQAAKDYVFDIDRFTSFEGNTGPYILYTIVRIKSILAKYEESSDVKVDYSYLKPAIHESEKALGLELSKFNYVLNNAWKEIAPHRICQYIYSLSNLFNSFYHEVKILSEEDKERKLSYLALILLTKSVLEDCIDILAIKAPERM